MAKEKFIYNSQTLSFEKVEMTFSKRMRRILTFGAVGLFLATAFIIVFYTFFDSPKEKLLKREIDELTLQYELLNDRTKQVETVLGDLQQRDDNIYRVIFEADPIPAEVREAGVGGVNRYKPLQGFNHSELMEQTMRGLDNIARKMYVQSKSFDDVFEMAKNKTQMLASLPAIQPISNKNLTRVASGFGFRIHPVYKTKKLHTGMDFTAPMGTEIYATGDGVVLDAPTSGQGYGNHILMDHSFGYQTLYAHLSRIIVVPGQNVKRGEVIGYVGNSGTSLGPHLHYEVIKNNIKINPMNYYFNDLTPEEYEKMIEIASKVNQSFD